MLSGRDVNGHCVRRTKANRSHHYCTRRVRLHIRYRLSGEAQLTFRVRRLVAGRRVKGNCVKSTMAKRLHHRCKLLRAPFVKAHMRLVNGRCVKRSDAGRHGRRCTRRIEVDARRRRSAHAGANSVTLELFFAGHVLAPGAYRLIATPVAGSMTADASYSGFKLER